MTSSLLRLKRCSSSQMRRLRRSILSETERTAGTYLLWKRTGCACTLSKTKHLVSFMSLGFVASNGAVMPLIWFPSGYRLLTARNYEAKLTDKLVPWINNTFDISSVTAVLQQDGAPAHTPKRVQHSCKIKIAPSGRKTCGRHSRQAPTH